MAQLSAPQFIGQPLPILPLQPGEARWICPGPVHRLVWDGDNGPAKESLAALRALLTQSLAAPLLPAQQQEARLRSCRCVQPSPDIAQASAVRRSSQRWSRTRPCWRAAA